MEAGLTYKKPSCIAARGRICNLFLEQVRSVTTATRSSIVCPLLIACFISFLNWLEYTISRVISEIQ